MCKVKIACMEHIGPGHDSLLFVIIAVFNCLILLIKFEFMTINKMTKKYSAVHQDNVNGVPLTLKLSSAEMQNNKLRNFVISFITKENRSYFSKSSLIFAVLFNILAFSYERTSLTAISIILTVFSFLIFFWITHSVQSESLLVIPTVGIQSSVKYVCGKEDHFYSWTNIDDIIINEVIKRNRVLYFLTAIVKTNGESSQETEGLKLIPLFKYTKPRLTMLEVVYGEIQTLLQESQGDLSSLAAGDTLSTE